MKTFVYLLTTVVAAFLIILIIFHFGKIPNRQNNGFKRSYFPVSYSALHEIRFTDTVHEVIGSTPSHIYVSLARKDELLEIGSGKGNPVRRIRVPFYAKYYDSLQLGSLSVKVDSPFIYLFAENKPAIVRTSFDSSLFEVRILPPGPFSREVMAGRNVFILRKFERRLTDQIFVKYDFGTGGLKKEDSISSIYGDGGIITDGQLHFDEATNKLCYVYFYKNLLLSFDTALDHVSSAYSIDTTRSFQIKTGLVENSGTKAYTNIGPVTMINKASAVGNGLLFNLSGLKADNESSSFFSSHSIIDVVDISSGKYLGSMSFPLVEGQKLSQFGVSDGHLIGLYTNSVVIYDLPSGAAQ